mmetsp:Transcript_43926/g.65150  ORF Transcript_43926/g.65150 Transcript_43926/m.65150 type:complete len:112 (-) Transcript_43926:275-610(-)
MPVEWILASINFGFHIGCSHMCCYTGTYCHICSICLAASGAEVALDQFIVQEEKRWTEQQQQMNLKLDGAEHEVDNSGSSNNNSIPTSDDNGSIPRLRQGQCETGIQTEEM